MNVVVALPLQVEGPLDISLGVPVEDDSPPKPSTSKPGSKISLWVVPRGEGADDDAGEDEGKVSHGKNKNLNCVFTM